MSSADVQEPPTPPAPTTTAPSGPGQATGSQPPARKSALKSLVPRSLVNWYFDWLSWFAVKSFGFFEKFGFYIIHRAFYGPIPDSRNLTANLWAKPSEMIGINLRPQAQLDLMKALSDSFCQEYASIPDHPTADPAQYCYRNPFFGPGDAHLVYGLVRKHKPTRIIEVGSGNSTRLICQAIRLNEQETGKRCRYSVVDPYPDAVVGGGIPEMSELIRKPVQGVPLSLFSELGQDDILFIDSSHVLKLGSDCQYEFLEVLPRLKAGVLVHFHDIFLPAEYPREWAMKDRRFWNEQYALQLFLTHNDRFEVLWGSQFMLTNHLPEMMQAFPQVKQWEQPGSFWIRHIK